MSSSPLDGSILGRFWGSGFGPHFPKMTPRDFFGKKLNQKWKKFDTLYTDGKIQGLWKLPPLAFWFRKSTFLKKREKTVFFRSHFFWFQKSTEKSSLFSDPWGGGGILKKRVFFWTGFLPMKTRKPVFGQNGHFWPLTNWLFWAIFAEIHLGPI